ncbi:MAG TPA: HNH endonuclease signature motif containing protein [Chloroflexia bacterium]|nr:HNH endonuclease signature motif containing protein [Chloroflexia bacterium]
MGYTSGMDLELSQRHKQVLSLERLRRRRGYREGWLYHLCRQKGLLAELHDVQMAGMLDEEPGAEITRRQPVEVGVGEDGELLVPRTLLTVELVPRTCWFSNLRSELSKEQWDKLRRAVYERAGDCCEICGQKGRQHPVECHEVWEYDDERHVQRLAGLLAVCPACHEAKHMGYASTVGRAGQARAHLARVNGWSMEDVELYLEMQFEQWSRRSNHEWSLDLSWLDQFGIVVSPKRGGGRR